MKAFARRFALTLLLSAVSCLSLHAEEDKLFESDGLGKLALGQKAAVVLKELGKPESKGKDEEWDAIGEWVQEWKYPKQGISVKMAAAEAKGERKILMITASGTCSLATTRGIKIGSAEDEVAKAYKDVRNAEESKAGQTFVAGSIYGGVIFTLSKGKVSEIFIGAAAE